ncbi:PREDICTED: uncharacterized protein LOC104597181 isoform X2 [Nelumbo nucifera]|uniref:Uncharacterized protein LOC104597181 isoform X2 n=1 Tax=Nelumbo nucifera TaxID=4432 RepID=A0A1U7ZXB2_NELNU|nr:PREDICTED: uncharacterized protein LOC104597181 isoform X2 [Nelumbo nucifera]
MKFEDFLMQRSEDQQKRLDLEEEVIKLQAEFEDEQKLNRALKYAVHGPVSSHPSFSSMLPIQVQVLLAELTMLEEEIISLETKIEELKRCLRKEKKQNRECELRRVQQHRWRQLKGKHLIYGLESLKGLADIEISPIPPPYDTEDYRSQQLKVSVAPASEFRTMNSTSLNGTDEFAEILRRCNARSQKQSLLADEETNTEKPNSLSEELIRCLIEIFLKLNQTPASQLDCESSTTVPKLTLSCINSRGFKPKTSFNCKAPMSFLDDNTSVVDPYGILSDHDDTLRDVGPYKNFIQITRSSLDMSRVSECLPAIGKMRILIHKLCSVDLSLLTYKQKLAFWINIYNACIMHAFLQHGLPSTPDKLLSLMNKAALNVGGIVLNVLAIEHFILRYPQDSKISNADEKEMLLRHAYGLGYPEPNVTFALCRGSWSSPAFSIKGRCG